MFTLNMRGVLLNTGAELPLLGLGTFKLKDSEEVTRALDSALANGYRLIDTAAVYKNEKMIGECLPTLLKKYGLEREDVFVTTKLGPKDLDGLSTRNAVMTSMRNLRLNYIDLYLIHWPAKQGLKREDFAHKTFRRDCWAALEDIHMESKTLRAIGVSNYTLNHLKETLSHCRIKPAVLQSEFHPDYQQKEVVEFCKTNNIHFQAYSSLGCGALVLDERFSDVARKHHKTISQVLLRWAVEKGCSVIPKSSCPVRIRENAGVFDFSISPQDLRSIDTAGKCVKYAWDPSSVP